MPGGQRHHRRLQPRPKRRRADELRQPGAGPCATVPAAQLVRAMLGHDHADRRQLADLVATEPPARPALSIIEPTPASAARIRIVIDDLIHLILGLQLATRTPMPGLPTSLRRSPSRRISSLAFARASARRSPASSADPSTAAWSSCANPAAPAPQPPQPILVPLNPAREIENELNTRLTPRVINRLRLGTIHACKIRCTNKESLPQAPTTERLQKPHYVQGILTVTPDGKARSHAPIFSARSS